MKTALIFGGAPCRGEKQPVPPEADLVICADAGLRLAAAMGIQPDAAVGDFDTLGMIPTGVAVELFPPEKDDTDMMLAVKYGLAQGCDRFVIYGGLGGRLDHFMANLQMLSFLAERGAQGVLVDENHWMTLQSGGTTVCYPRREGMVFSLFAIHRACEGVTIRGVKYPLENGVLTAAFPLGVSNSITAQQAEVTVEKGDLLVMYARDVQ